MIDFIIKIKNKYYSIQMYLYANTGIFIISVYPYDYIHINNYTNVYIYFSDKWRNKMWVRLLILIGRCRLCMIPRSYYIRPSHRVGIGVWLTQAAM